MITFETTFSHPVCDFEMICGGVYIGTSDFTAHIHVWIDDRADDYDWDVEKWTNEDNVEIAEPWRNSHTSWLFEQLERHRKNDAKWREAVEVEIGYRLPYRDDNAEHRLRKHQLV